MARLWNWFRRSTDDDDSWDDWLPGEDEAVWHDDIVSYNEETLYGESTGARRLRYGRLVVSGLLIWGVFMGFGILTTPRWHGHPVVLTIPMRAERQYLTRADQTFRLSTSQANANLLLLQNVRARRMSSYAAGAALTHALAATNLLLQQEQPVRAPANYVVIQAQLVHLLSVQTSLLQSELTALTTPGGTLVSSTWVAYHAEWQTLANNLSAANRQVAIPWPGLTLG